MRAAPGDADAARRARPAPTCRRCARPATPATTPRADARAAPRPRARARSDDRVLTGLGHARAGPPRLLAAAWRYGLAARRADPDADAPYPVIVDAYVELGRYDAAGARRCSASSTSKPTLASYARVSYFRELHGDLPGAPQAMRAGGLGRRRRGRERRLRPDAARHARVRPRPARRRPAGLPRSRSRASRATCRPPPGSRASTRPSGRTGAAIRRYRDVVARLPLPEYVVGARRDRAGGRARRPGAAATSRWSAPRSACCRPTASTPTSTSPCSRPTTAARPARSRWRGAPGPPRRACARPTRSAGR